MSWPGGAAGSPLKKNPGVFFLRRRCEWDFALINAKSPDPGSAWQVPIPPGG